jgi:hypothetical protein
VKQSDRLDIIIAAILALILALACLPAHSKTKQVNLEATHCVKKLTLIDCDLNTNPLKCRTVELQLTSAACPIIHLENSKEKQP